MESVGAWAAGRVAELVEDPAANVGLARAVLSACGPAPTLVLRYKEPLQESRQQNCSHQRIVSPSFISQIADTKKISSRPRRRYRKRSRLLRHQSRLFRSDRLPRDIAKTADPPKEPRDAFWPLFQVPPFPFRLTRRGGARVGLLQGLAGALGRASGAPGWWAARGRRLCRGLPEKHCWDGDVIR